jgi:hypothetical protein
MGDRIHGSGIRQILMKDHPLDQLYILHVRHQWDKAVTPRL